MHSPMFVHEVQGKEAQKVVKAAHQRTVYTDSRQLLWLLVLQNSPQCLTQQGPVGSLWGALNEGLPWAFVEKRQH